MGTEFNTLLFQQKNHTHITEANMQLHMLYIESIPCCRTSMMEMRRNSSGIGAIAVAGLMKENDLDNEADALIHYIRNELHFENQFEVSYCKLQGSNPRLVINMVMGYIEEIQPERIMFGCRGYVRLPESEDQTHDIKTFKNQCRLVRHKKCESCKKELENKKEERRK